MYPIDKQNLEEDNREGLVYYSKLYLSCMSFSKNKKEVENYKKFHDEFVENIYKQENNFDEKFVEDNFNEEIKKLVKKGKNLEEKIGLLHDLYAKLDYNNEMSNLDRKGLYKVQKSQLEFADKVNDLEYKDILATCKNVGKILSNDKMIEVLIAKSGKNVSVEDFRKIVETSFDNHNQNLINKRDDYMSKLMKYEVDLYKTKYVNSLEKIM